MLIGSGVCTRVVLALKFMLSFAPRVREIFSSTAYGEASDAIDELESPSNEPTAVMDGEMVGALKAAGHPAV